MNFTVGRCRFSISPLFSAMAALLLLIDTTGMMPALLGAMLLHEAGHFCVMLAFGCPPAAVRLHLFEVAINAPVASLSSFRQGLVAAGGLLVNTAAACVCTGRFGTANWLLAVANGLPLYSLDGYQLLAAVLFGAKRRCLILAIVSTTAAVCMAGAIGLYCCRFHDPLPLLYLIYLVLLVLRGKKAKNCLASAGGMV